MSLLDLQSALRDWLPSGAEELPAALDASSAAGMRVYRNNYRSQLITCLEHCYPRTRDWLGADAFLSACSAHVDEVPPISWTIDAYGLGLLTTLSKLYPNDLEVTELAWLEWALGESFVSRDEPSLNTEDLAGVNWGEAALVLTGSLTLRPALTNAGAIWSALNEGEVPQGATSLPGGSGYLVWRTGFQSHFRTLDPLEYAALFSIAEGTTFPELCTALVEDVGEETAVALAAEWLGRWIADGLIARVT